MGTAAKEAGTAALSAAVGRVQNRLRLHPASQIADSAPESASVRVDSESMSIPILLQKSREAQKDWASYTVDRRLQILKGLRQKIAVAPRSLAVQVRRSDVAETLAAEVLPFLDACRYLELDAARILKEKKPGKRGRPMWLWGNSVVLRPEPRGVVLIIGPSNYPLMLPGIQALQALAAGNSVLIKPAAGCSGCVEFLSELATSAGLPSGLLQILSESPEAAMAAIEGGVDKVFLTGSASTGKVVRQQLAVSGTPSVMELSGCDAVFVLDDADLELVSDCLVFGLTLNHSQTCMAPRRVFVTDAQCDRLLSLLKTKLDATSSAFLHADADNAEKTRNHHVDIAAPVVRAAMAAGATMSYGTYTTGGDLNLSRPVVLDHVAPHMSVAQSDLFVPVVSFLRADSESDMLQQNLKCPYALSATIFGSSEQCQKFARLVSAGCIVINDMIAPSADPRVPFGGRGMSGDGMTRGEAGLLEMTQLKAIVTARRFFRPHLQQKTVADAAVLENLIRLEHAATPLQSLMALPKMITATIQQIRLRLGRS